MFQARTFKNEFAIELNYLYEFDVYFDGIRLHQNISTLDKKIKEDNDQIISELVHEDPDVKTSILNQVNVSNALYDFHDMLFKSFLITTYSWLEKSLKEICVICAKHNSLPNYTSLRRGKYRHCTDLSAPKEYLTEYLKIDIHEFDDFWNGFDLYTKLRKSIVHHNSSIIDGKLLTSFKLGESLLVKDGSILILNKSILVRFIDESSLLIKNIIDIINRDFNLIEEC